MTMSDFDFIDYLNSEEDIQDFLEEVLSNGASPKAVKNAYMVAEQARAKLANEKPSIGTAQMFFNLWQRQQQNNLATF